ncbi:MAG: flavodoxin-dependent (E)-4-hydroxy-3-methylbut-2-enyl-diphosphate synthase [Deltaproteobacteria bacterium]|nr:flavodoxin-dependent (E)-4-hydroxy-3-methylbut-2-enyl-diphosphate synthase [Deltaproteobacteria bacterium]
MIKRRETRQLFVGNVKVGGGAPVSVQSMTNTKTADCRATIAQIKSLAEAGCEIVRIAVLNMEDAKSIGQIVSESEIPVIADIHFNHSLAIESVRQGVHGLRLNPGNIGGKKRVKQVVEVAGAHNIPIRIGVNAGSLEKEILEKYGYPTAAGMVESAMNHIAILEEFDFCNIKVSLKASDVPRTIEAYRELSKRVDYPLHLGVTEAGTSFSGTIKSAVGVGTLLAEGIGDTIRVSLSADPVEEVKVGFEILKSLQIRSKGVNVISCPTCGRMQVDLIRLANEVEKRLAHIEAPLNVSVLGCVVNGIGEALEADAGIAGGKDEGLLFSEGEVVGKIAEDKLVDALVDEVEKIAARND